MTDRSEALARARQTVQTEIAGLELLSAALGDSMGAAVDCILAAKGRVIVTGMGKSGHIARKIAATFASTGTPAYFVHPAEASHGDLGMIGADDVVIALSNSGESPELSSLITYARRSKIPLIALSRDPASALGKAADILLQLPSAKEACPLEMAPTTSTTLSLVMGDALAMAVLEARGFTKADFGRYHPGGKLGDQLRTVGDIASQMGHQLPVVTLDQSMAEVVLVMTEGRLGAVAVQAEDGALAGIITDGDLRRGLADGVLARRAEELMTGNPLTVDAHALAVDALAVMEDKRVTVLFILNEKRQPEAAVHIHDLLRVRAA